MTFLKKKLREIVLFVGEYSFEVAEQSDGFEGQLFEQQVTLLEEAVKVLPHRKHETFRLHRFEGLSKEEVAAELGISAASVSHYLK